MERKVPGVRRFDDCLRTQITFWICLLDAPDGNIVEG